MDHVNILSDYLFENRIAGASKAKSKKRKWREIEAIHENFRLKKELSDIELDLEYELAALEQ